MTADILHNLAIGIVLPEIVIVVAFIWQEPPNSWVSCAFGNDHAVQYVPVFFPVFPVFQISLQLISSFSPMSFWLSHTPTLFILSSCTSPWTQVSPPCYSPPTHVTTSQLAHTLPSLWVTLRLPRLLGLPCHEDYFHHGTLTAEARPLMENWFRQLNRPRESCVRDRTADVRCVDCSGSPWELESSLSL